jgi:sugar phosphate isomerase/epimerase
MKAAVMDTVLAVDDVVAEAGRLGFAGIELNATRTQLRSADQGAVERLRRDAAGASLLLHSLVLGEHNHGGVASADPHTAARTDEEVRLAIGLAAELGADVVLIPFFLEAQLHTDDDVDRCAAAFAALCPVAAERGVTLCFEGLLPAERIRELAARVASPAFGCTFDLANPLRRGLDPPTEIRSLGSLVRRVHVKDMLVRPGDVRPGRGRVDFAECARALGEIGYDGWLTLETPRALPPLVARDLSFTCSIFPALTASSAWPRFGAFSYEHAAGEWERLVADFDRLGLQAVQLGSELLDECLADPGSAAARRAYLDVHGVAGVALAGYRNLVSPDAAVRKANVDYLARCLELAPSLGTYVVATETGTRDATGDWTDSPENWGDRAWQLLDEALETLLTVAERAGAILALEAHVKNVLKTQSQLLELLERFPTPHLQVVCDPYNYLSRHLLPAQQHATAELLDRFEDRFVIAHLKDVDPRGAEAGSPAFGTGAFAQAPYLEFLRERRPDLPLILEHLPLEGIPAAIGRVREATNAPVGATA